MSLPSSLHAYPQELDAFERAAASEKGIRYSFAQEGPARHFISRLHRMRALHRKANSEALEPGHPLYGRSEFDLFTCFVRFDGEKWWVYIRKIEGLDVEYEELTEETYDPPKLEPPRIDMQQLLPPPKVFRR